MKILFLLFITFLSNFILAQSFVPPIPNKNIDSLISSTKIYKSYNRINSEPAIRISFKIDSTGATDTLFFNPMFKNFFNHIDSIFIEELRPKLKTIRWLPATYNNIAVNTVYTVPFVMFYVNPMEFINNYYGGKNKNTVSLLGNHNYSKPIIKIRDAALLTKSCSH